MNNLTDPVLPPQSSPTARSTPDSLGLGQTSGQRGAEILAGFRAEKYPSPDTLALSRWSGRIIVRMLMRMLQNNAPMNFVFARTECFETLVRRALPAVVDKAIIVEIACGLSPRGLRLAREFPQARVIEVDLPGVIQDKQQRLQGAKNVTIPPNIEWRAGDLGVTPLLDILGGQTVDIVTAEGLFAYFPPEAVTKMGGRIKDCLKPGGHLIASIPWKEKMDSIRSVASFFSKQAGVYQCQVKDEEAARQLLLTAGYEMVMVHLASLMAGELKLPQPMVDYSLFVSAQKAKD
ncbi:MAG TPA: class I SAM-dependent methyltransferase [Phototrophicaceae bacterium]|nr:class I SAM-dependent methyltransferase [Phototrophicaceae bacterium]